MLNWQQVRQLQTDVGKEDMPEVVELFICEVDEALENLQINYADMALEDSCAAFHFLKGCASNLGFQAFGDMCTKGESTTKNGQKPDFEITDFADIYTRSKQQFLQEYDAQLM